MSQSELTKYLSLSHSERVVYVDKLITKHNADFAVGYFIGLIEEIEDMAPKDGILCLSEIRDAMAESLRKNPGDINGTD